MIQATLIRGYESILSLLPRARLFEERISPSPLSTSVNECRQKILWDSLEGPSICDGTSTLNSVTTFRHL
jgi:hypothetical protein